MRSKFAPHGFFFEPNNFFSLFVVLFDGERGLLDKESF